MKPEHQEVFNVLKDRITSVISMYEACNKEKQDIIKEKNQLEIEKEELEKKLAQLEGKHETLRLAKSVSLSKEDKQEAKMKINNIVREIDKCIALLNK